MSLRLRDLQQILGKFTNGNKGTSISDCFIYMENDQGGLNEIGKIELQESRLIGKVNGSSAWRVVLKKDPRSVYLQSTTYRK
jgi:hypothetical protein|tara:strand:- start:196 stop:441 length:246 start_codon:yes stop_codon:yes gene_type:complete